MNADPIEDFIDQLRPTLRRYQEQFERGEVTGIAITGRNERKQRHSRWHVRVAPESDEKVIETWSAEPALRAIPR